MRSDTNFDGVAASFEEEVYGSSKGYVSERVLWEDLSNGLPRISRGGPSILDAGGGAGRMPIRLLGIVEDDAEGVAFAGAQRAHAVADVDSVAATLTFDGGWLSLARLSRGLNKKQLAEMVGVTPAAIRQFERGLSQPSVPVIAKLRWALRFPPEFFEGGRRRFEVRHDEVHFRRLRSTSKMERSQVLARAELLAELEKYLKIPKVAIPDIPMLGDSRAEIEAAAEVREQWVWGSARYQRWCASWRARAAW